MSQKKQSTERNGQAKQSLPPVWTRAITPASQWPDKVGFPDVSFYTTVYRRLGEKKWCPDNNKKNPCVIGRFARRHMWAAALVTGLPTASDEFLDVIYWSRQVTALIFGIIWGLLPFKGSIGIILFCALNSLVTYLYATSFQKVDDEEYGGPWEIVKEGFMVAFAGFLVTWIIVYSALYHDDYSSF